MKYEKELGVDFDIALSEEHIRKKEKRYISMKKQKQHKQCLLYELSHCIKALSAEQLLSDIWPTTIQRMIMRHVAEIRLNCFARL